MSERQIGESELIVNTDGSAFHLHLRPGQVPQNVILVGDPGRVELVSSFFSRIEARVSNREFTSHLGVFNNTPLLVVSTGIGTDNIDIVINEIDALVNVDFVSRTPKSVPTTLRFVRIGTSGALQESLEVDEPVLGRVGCGFDNLMRFYDFGVETALLPLQRAFYEQMHWSLPFDPYFVSASENLASFIGNGMPEGITISAPGFYGPQGRFVRAGLADSSINRHLERFQYENLAFTNYEMECSAIYGLSRLLGHEAATVCLIIANRIRKQFSRDYKPPMKRLIARVLDQITVL